MDSDQFELLKRRLEEQVKDSVEARLFQYYRNMAGIVVAVLAFVGIAIGWPALNSMVVSTVEKQVADKVDAPVSEAAAAAKLAGTASMEAKWLAEKTRDDATARQDDLNTKIGRLDGRYDDAVSKVGQAQEQAQALEDSAEDLQGAYKGLKDLLQSDPVSRKDLEDLKLSVAGIAHQAADVAAALAAIGSASPPIVSDAEGAKAGLQEIATQQTDQVTKANDTSVNPRQKTNVFVQFAGGRRSDIQSVSARLRQKQWTVPGEERTPSAAGKKEIRYFFQDDKDAADALTLDLNTIFQSLMPTIQVVPKLAYVTKLPARGTLEVWVEIPLRFASE